MRLAREVRFHATPGHGTVAGNSWAGTPLHAALGNFMTVRATVEGPVDPRTGYVCNIQLIDAFLHRDVIPMILHAFTEGIAATPSRLGDVLLDAIQRTLPAGCAPAGLVGLRLNLSPFTYLELSKETADMISLIQSFEFSASHRLFCPTMSEVENREVFGKCANPNGHGHNYVLDVTIAADQRGQEAPAFDLPALDRLVKTEIIDRFDHKHLNLDCPEFAELNPSVENIARVIWNRLHARIAGDLLRTVRVWETPKTFAEFDGR